MQSHKNILLAASLVLFGLLVAASLVAITSEGFYAKETLNWKTQSIAQDWVDLCVISPVLLLSSILGYRGNKLATALWAGSLFYLTYTFAIYSFDVQFNKLFVIYCLVLGISFYLSLYYVLNSYKGSNLQFKKTRVTKVIAWYFIVVAILFYALWLSEIIPAISAGVIPASTVDAGLPTNAVHVIDLSIFLPAIAICGILMLRKNMFGFALAPALLSFFILMDITIAVLSFFMFQNGLVQSFAVAVVMFVLAAVSLTLCRWFIMSQANQLHHEIVSKDPHQLLAIV